MSTSFRICKVLTLPASGLFTDAMYLVKAGQDNFDCYVTDNAGHALRLAPGESAYAAAVRAGFNGTEQQWLDSLKGDTGLSAYQIAVLNGFNGTEQEWLDSLHGNAGYTAENVDNKSDDNTLANTSADAYPTVRAAKGYVDTKAGQTLEAANTASGQAVTTAENNAKAFASTAATTAENNAKSYAQTAANDAEVAAKAYADLILASAISLRGGYDASGNAWPATGGTGTAGAINAGNLWFVSVPGTLGGKSVVVGDSFFAVTNNPGQTNANWCVLDTNLGFVPEEAGTAAAAISAHLLAADPHGDRAYVNAALANFVRFDAVQTLTNPQKTQARENIGAEAAGAAANAQQAAQNYTDNAISLLSNPAKTSGYIDDFIDLTESNTRSINSNLTAITCAELTAANLNWIGAARIKATTTGGYFRAFTLVNSRSDTFTFQPSRGAVEACATLYIPACNSGSSIFMGLVKDSVQSLGDPAKLVVLQYDAGTSANWRLRKTDGTFVDTGVAFALSTEVHLRVKLSGTTCTAYINGTLVATTTVTASDATTYMASFGLTHAGAGSNDVDIWADYIGHQQTLSATRSNFGFV